MKYSEWETVKVGDLGVIVTGKTPKTSEECFFGGGIPFLTPSDDMNKKGIENTKRTLTEEGGKTVKNCILPAGSICVSCIGSDLGKVTMTRDRTVTNQQINSIVVNEKYDKNFIYYLMCILGKKLNFVSKTSTAVPIVNKSSFSSYEVEVPNLFLQSKIANILSCIDDKIELNNKLNDNLFYLADLLYNQYFCNYERYENSLRESEMGLIPDEWEVVTLDDIIELFDSKRVPLSSKQRENMKKKYPYYGAASIVDYVEEYIFDGIYVLISEDGANVVDQKGYPLLQYVWGKFWVNNHAHITKGKKGFNEQSIYVLLRNTNMQSIVTGAVQPKINQANLKSVKVVIPSGEVITQFTCAVDKLFEQYRYNIDQNNTLIQLRDTLLPKLMSGEIDLDKFELDI